MTYYHKGSPRASTLWVECVAVTYFTVFDHRAHFKEIVAAYFQSRRDDLAILVFHSFVEDDNSFLHDVVVTKDNLSCIGYY